MFLSTTCCRMLRQVLPFVQATKKVSKNPQRNMRGNYGFHSLPAHSHVVHLSLREARCECGPCGECDPCASRYHAHCEHELECRSEPSPVCRICDRRNVTPHVCGFIKQDTNEQTSQRWQRSVVCWYSCMGFGQEEVYARRTCCVGHAKCKCNLINISRTYHSQFLTCLEDPTSCSVCLPLSKLRERTCSVIILSHRVPC